eukprot:scaffold47334_cov43-Attheya_sp.AAC.4
MGNCEYLTPSEPEGLEDLMVEQEKVKDFLWEWTLLRFNSVSPLPKEGIFKSDKMDPFAEMRTNGKVPPIYFGKNINEHTTPVIWDAESPTWYGILWCAYEKGTASTVTVTLKDKNVLMKDTTLVKRVLAVPHVWDKWVDHDIKQDNIKISVSLYRSCTPLFTSEEQAAIGLTEVLFDLNSGEKASLAYRVDEAGAHKKAVFFFPGRSDSFTQPHVFASYWRRGYDFYTLDLRKCGRTRRFLKDPHKANDVDSFDTYKEEIDMALDFMAKQKKYDSVVAMAHSTGAPVLINYIMLQKEKKKEVPFSAYVMNSPFLDWGHVGGDLYEFALEHANWILKLDPDFIGIKGVGVDRYITAGWLLYRWNLTMRPILCSDLTAKWANAATRVHAKINARKGQPIITKPSLVLSSQSDIVLEHLETVNLAQNVFLNPNIVEFKRHGHDVFFSPFKEYNDLSIQELENFLDSLELV